MLRGDIAARHGLEDAHEHVGAEERCCDVRILQIQDWGGEGLESRRRGDGKVDQLSKPGY